MKKVLFLISILILVLLAGCGSREAKEPVPEWPERLTGEPVWKEYPLSLARGQTAPLQRGSL